MDQIKVALSMILAEDEPADIVKRSIESIEKFVDGIFITVTYKEKQPGDSPLIQILKEKKANISFWKWNYRFDEARNFAASQIPKDYLFYIWQDADDIWYNTNQLPQIIKDAYLNNWSAVFFNYWYLVELDEQGNIRQILVEHKRERLIRNDDTFKWIGRLHETLIEQRQFNVIKVFRQEAWVIHLTTPDRSTKNLHRNIAILEEAVQKEKRNDPRTIMYLAKAYYDRARIQAKEEDKKTDFQMGETLFAEYLQGSGKPGANYKGGSGWSEERSNAWEYLSEIYRSNGQYNRAIKATLNSLIEGPQFPQYYLNMCMNYILLKDWSKGEIWLNIAKTVPNPNTTLISTPRDIKARAFEAEYHLGMAKADLERAYEASKALVEIFPNDKNMLDRLHQTENLRMLNKVAQSIIYVGKYLEGIRDTDKLINLTHAIPTDLDKEQFVAQMRQKFLPSKLWAKDEITIVCGPGFEKWSPKSIERGIGGSEAAVIYQAKELAKLGYKVTVYGDSQDESGEYEGVTYLPWYFVNIKDVFNILILWRAIGFVDHNFYARKTYLWAHDVPSIADFTEERLKQINKIFVLSKYHRNLFRMMKNNEPVEISDEKFLETRNGIITYPSKKIKRDPYRMIYASSYDRGLPHLLTSWPEIKKQVPQANLHCYYGWNTYDAIFRDNPERQHWKSEMKKLMSQDGITDHERISHQQLAEEFIRSGIFAYSCDFQEISCQVAMMAQVYGAIPVVTNYAALKETVKFGKKLDIDITSKEGKETYVKELVEALKNHQWQEEERTKMIVEMKGKFTWQGVAEQWDQLFKMK